MKYDNVVGGALTGLAIGGLLALGIAQKADAADRWVPDSDNYCNEVLQDGPALLHTEGANECRQHGWTLRAHLIVDPENWLRWTDVPACRLEDSRRCYWNAHYRGNGTGDSFVRVGGHFYIVGMDPQR